jgi:DNA-binding SARP family transcriptional activator/Flp pilus assembly protein TadD
MASLEIFLLGSPRIESGGSLIEPDTRKAIALLAYLAVSGELHTREELAALLWPEYDSPRGRAALRRTLSALKTAAGETALFISRDTLGLVSEHLWCDYQEFQAAAAAVASHKHNHIVCAECMSRLEAAVLLYRDDFLTGFSLRDSLPFDDWQIQQAEYLRRLLATMLEQLVQTKASLGLYTDALPYARRWLELDPLREEAHRQLMRLYDWTGQRSAALQQYRRCLHILEEELGVAPLAETTELYETIQAGQLAPPIAGQPEIIRSAGAIETTPAAMPLIGRQGELLAMQAIYDRLGPDGHFLVVAGEAGIGKSRLAEAFLASRPDARRLLAHCYDGETGLTYGPFAQAIRDALQQAEALERLAPIRPHWLAEAARLLPEMNQFFTDLPTPPPFDWPGAPGRFWEGLSRVLATLLTGPRPGVLWLDDVQWADSASLDLLAYLVRRWQGRPYLILACWREGELPADHQLHQLLAESRRTGTGHYLSLNRLALDEVAELVRAWLPAGGAAGETWIRRLYQETEGLPFLVTTYLQLTAQPEFDPQATWPMPATVRDLFQSRLAQSGEMAGQLLQAAAVIGRAFSFDLLQAASGRSEEESLPALEELLNQNLLLEQAGSPVYAFSHHKLRELIYGDLSLVRRRLLHRRVAVALQGQSGPRPAELAGQIAAHYQAAGQDAEAAAFHRQAGDHARSLFALQEALDHYQAALALGYPDPAALHEACGDLQTRLGQYSAALTSYERAVAAGPAGRLPRLEHKIGQVYHRLGEWQLAERHFEQATATWPASEAADSLSRLYLDWSTTAFRAGRMDQAAELAEKAQGLAVEPLSQAQVCNVLGLLARKQGHLAQAVEQFDHSLSLARTGGYLEVQIAALNNLALVEAAAGRLEQAQTLLREALVHCQTYGDRHWEAALHNNLADALHLSGQKEATMAHLKQAVAIYAEIGRETGEWQPEIWKLTEW